MKHVGQILGLVVVILGLLTTIFPYDVYGEIPGIFFIAGGVLLIFMSGYDYPKSPTFFKVFKTYDEYNTFVVELENKIREDGVVEEVDNELTPFEPLDKELDDWREEVVNSQGEINKLEKLLAIEEDDFKAKQIRLDIQCHKENIMIAKQHIRNLNKEIIKLQKSKENN